MSHTLEELNALVDAACAACAVTGWSLQPMSVAPEVIVLRAAIAEMCAERDGLRDFSVASENMPLPPMTADDRKATITVYTPATSSDKLVTGSQSTIARVKFPADLASPARPGTPDTAEDVAYLNDQPAKGVPDAHTS